MIRNSSRIIRDKKLQGKSGGWANESRFGGWERELREKKTITVPSMTLGCALKIEQGWNKVAKNMDILRLTAISRDKSKIQIVVEREDIEQAFAYLAQGDELIKWAPPSKIKTNS